MRFIILQHLVYVYIHIVANVALSESDAVELSQYTGALVKAFRIIHEFKILRLTFHRKSASKS